MKLQDRVYTYRVMNRLKQHDMAEKLGVSQSYYSLIESGKRIPNNELVSKLNKLIGE